jgi:hypothetical protein
MKELMRNVRWFLRKYNENARQCEPSEPGKKTV